MSTKYYLVEPANVGDKNGKISGKSLRTYEVTLEEVTKQGYNGAYKQTEASPTGVMYIYADGEFKSKKTKATLANKYLSFYNGVNIASRLEDINGYGCTLFATPELAILAKVHTINAQKVTLINDAKQLISDIETNTKDHIDAYSKLTEEYPEYCI